MTALLLAQQVICGLQQNVFTRLHNPLLTTHNLVKQLSASEHVADECPQRASDYDRKAKQEKKEFTHESFPCPNVYRLARADATKLY